MLKTRLLWPAAYLLRSLVKVLGLTYRFEVLHASRLSALLATAQPVVVVFWHQQTFAAAYFVAEKLHRKGLELVLLASYSRDGELASRLAQLLKIRVIRGSASSGGRVALRALHRSLVKDRLSTILVADGSRGPKFHFKTGALVLSQVAQVPILPLAFAAERAWHLRSWDRMFVPKFRSRVVVAVGELSQIPRRLSEEEKAEHRQRLEELLNQLRHEAMELAAAAEV